MVAINQKGSRSDEGQRKKQSGKAPVPELTFAEFFSGIGLVRMALERHGWVVAFANDISPSKCQMYQHQFGASQHLKIGDIRTLTAEKVPNVTLATASFPCTDLSLAGSRSGLSGDESSTFWLFTDILTSMRRKPPIVLIENVPGFLTSHGGKDLREAVRTLNDIGYLVDLIIVDSVNFVPQSRARLFVIAHEPNRNTNAIATESELRTKSVVEFVKANADLKWNFRELPMLPARTIVLTDLIEDVANADVRWWSTVRKDYLLSQMTTRHRTVADSLIRSEAVQYGTIFRRMRDHISRAELRTDGIAGCLRTPRGGSARQIVFKAGNGTCAVRYMTPLESARLMGAPSFPIKVSTTNALFGFGDAVCVPVVEWIAEHYLNPLAQELGLVRGDSIDSCCDPVNTLCLENVLHGETPIWT